MSTCWYAFIRSAVNFKVRTLLFLFEQVINKYFRANTSINLESLKEMPIQEKNRYLDKLTV